MGRDSLAEVVTESHGLPNLAGRSVYRESISGIERRRRTIAARHGAAERWKQERAIVRNSELSGPVFVVRRNERVVPNAIKANSHVVEGGGAEQLRHAGRCVLLG